MVFKIAIPARGVHVYVHVCISSIHVYTCTLEYCNTLNTCTQCTRVYSSNSSIAIFTYCNTGDMYVKHRYEKPVLLRVLKFRENAD